MQRVKIEIETTRSALANFCAQASSLHHQITWRRLVFRGWEIVRKMNIWPRSEASRADVRFWGQSLSQGHYQPTCQQARKGFIYFLSLPLIFNSQNFKTARQHGKKASGDLMANARDWRVGVNLIGLTNFISTVIEPNLTSCHLKLILVRPLDQKLENLALLVHIFRRTVEKLD